jgi:anaerobic selenocysteine-containing dehydrogenase
MTPKLSYGAKTLLMEVIGDGGITRRDFLKKSVITVASATFLSVSLAKMPAHAAPPDLFCGCYSDCHGQCYSNCHCACHGNCGRKGW